MEALGKIVTTSFQPSNTVVDAKLWSLEARIWGLDCQVEHYFDFYNIEEDQKLVVASFNLDGEALDWCQWFLVTNS